MRGERRARRRGREFEVEGEGEGDEVKREGRRREVGVRKQAGAPRWCAILRQAEGRGERV